MSSQSNPIGFVRAHRARLFAAMALLLGAARPAAAADAPSGAKILQDLKAFNTMGTVLFIAMNFLIVNLIVDLLYVALDPRIRLGSK